MTKLHALSPILWTKNLQETILFYTSILGFDHRSNFPNFVSLRKDNIEIMMLEPAEEHESSFASFFATPTLTGSLYFYTEDVDELWNKIKDKVTIKTSLAERV